MRRTLGAIALCTLLSSAAGARADDGPRELGEPLTIAGIAVLASTYALTGATTTTLVIVANRREETIAFSWIPVVGPWIMLGDPAGFNALQLFGTAASGVLQAASLAMLIAGIVLSNEPPGATAWRMTPFASPDSVGLAVSGHL